MCFLDILPSDIKLHIIRPLLNDISLLCLRVAIYDYKIKKEDFNYSICQQIINYGIPLIDRFWDWLPHELDFPRIWAIHNGSLETLFHIERRGSKSSNLADIAVFTRHPSMERFLKKRNQWKDTGPIVKKIIHIPVLQWAIENNYNISEKGIWKEAARTGQLNVLQWLKNQGVKFLREIYNLAIISGDLNALLYLEEEGFSPDRFSLEKAVIFNQIDIVNHCWERTKDRLSPLNFSIILENAAYYGSLSSIKFLVEKGYPLTEKVYEQALASNNRNLLEYLDSIHCPQSKTVCYTAALYGYFTSLKYLVNKGFPLTEEIFRAAVFNSYHFDVVKYLYEIECPYDEESWNMAIKKKLLCVV